ncbi:hypothetical protein NW754_010637 [Fusarium falciforme]|nr:hypothetical protein NW754_010637 [Fusarium falciforme]
MANDCGLSSYWQFWGDCECSCPQSNPDIAGIGQVISSFITSSSLAIIATCLYLMLIRSGLKREDSFNPIDGWMRRNICDPWVRFVTKVPFIESRIDKIESTLFSFLLSLADVQLVTGIAMLSAAVIKLQDKNDGISAYHFSMVINLAWFSSMVHQLTLLAIRTKVVGSMKTQHRGVWPDRKNSSRSRRARAAIGWGGDLMVRVISMLILASLLLYCSYVSGAKDWYTYSYCSASCALGKEREANRCGGRGSISAWSCLSTQDDVYYFGQRWATGGLIMRDTLFLTTKAVKDHPRATHCHSGDG